ELASDDWEQQALTREVSLPIPALAQIGHGHISYQQLSNHITNHTVHDYFKFAFVRNPYDRFVSVCSFLTRNEPIPPAQTNAFMKSALTRPRFRGRILVRPQAEMLCDNAGSLAMNYIGQYEQLQTDFDQISQQTGMMGGSLTVTNVSKHDSYTAYYDQELLNMVNDFYLEDFEKLQYTMAEHPEEL
ncbi:MAG: sulfotransferase family 2 domain-containing protein, partial [Pseudomonadota bacterium]